jgi:Eukaryotic cytochrome b561
MTPTTTTITTTTTTSVAMVSACRLLLRLMTIVALTFKTTVMTVTVVVDASPVYQTRIPNGDKIMHLGQAWPAVGHTAPQGAPTLNPFGLAFQQSNHIWTIDLCFEDSDGDGLTNGQELGDPDCIWAIGQTPTRTTDITHPGFVTTTQEDDGVDGDEAEGSTAPAATTTEQQQQLTLPTWLVWHIALMMLSWGFLLPLGALIAISFRGHLAAKPSKHAKKPIWFILHVICQTLGVAAMIGGFVVAYQNIITHFNNTHKLFGVSIVAIGIVQFVMGFVRPHNPSQGEDKTLIRQVWEIVHKYLVGRVVIVLAWTNIFLGTKLVKNFFVGVPNSDNIHRGMNIVLGVQATLCVVLTVVSVFYKSQPPPASSSADNDAANEKNTSSSEMNDTTHAFSIVDQSSASKKKHSSGGGDGVGGEVSGSGSSSDEEQV